MGGDHHCLGFHRLAGNPPGCVPGCRGQLLRPQGANYGRHLPADRRGCRRVLTATRPDDRRLRPERIRLVLPTGRRSWWVSDSALLPPGLALLVPVVALAYIFGP